VALQDGCHVASSGLCLGLEDASNTHEKLQGEITIMKTQKQHK